MVYWAFFEMRLQELVFRALGVTDKQGRLAVKSMRASEMAKLADELLVISGEAIPWQLNSDAIKLLEERRNLLAHGVWLEHQGTLFLRDLTGSVVINGARVKKKIQPAGIPITIDALGNLADQIQQAIEDTQRAMSALHAQRQASRQTPA